MDQPRIALIHATPVAIDPIREAFASAWPQAHITNLLDDSLSSDLAAEGRLSEQMIARFVTLARYCAGTGANAILFTCSAFGVAIEAARAAVPIPVLKPNEAMFDEALAAGDRIGLLATFAPSVPALKTELEQMARERRLKIRISTLTVPSALKALHAGQPEVHDRIIAEAAEEIGDCDALILGQFSMASAAAAIADRPGRRVLTSPTSAVMQLRRVLTEKVAEHAAG